MQMQQISFILPTSPSRGHPVRIDFLATDMETARLRRTVEAVLGEHVSDLQVYATSAQAPGTATGLLQTVDDALRVTTPADQEIQARAAARVIAAEIDALAAAAPSKTSLSRIDLDFVWDNDGADNAFTQSFAAPTASIDVIHRFETALAAAYDRHVYGLSVTPHPLKVATSPDFALCDLCVALEALGRHDLSESLAAEGGVSWLKPSVAQAAAKTSHGYKP